MSLSSSPFPSHAASETAAASTPGPDRPDVIIFPPMLPVGGLLLGIALEWALPLAHWMHGLPAPVRQGGATLGIVAGVLLMATSRATLMRAKTNVDPRQPTLCLVERGPFHWTRNPMYLGGNLALLGVALAFRLPWVLLLFPVLIVTCHYGVVLREERYLERKFGAAYLDYKRRVRRWL